ncbi:hypothetical protein [Robiginitalea sp. SC105]|uniref:hypothetical protein n=1 Tax=Robiginitalea sp. SC105 TaxID=2762332 RepID=UPI00163A567F|nr:hypothetical protein [Robiginitalea sp. SC105]MBC2840276.1 hypothetical protein [Robiginitalea sp. SC105]
MKLQTILALLVFLASGSQVQGQFLKRLAKKAEKAAERTVLNRAGEESGKATDSALDSLLGTPEDGGNAGAAKGTPQGGTGVDYNTAKLINTDAKRSFYTMDVVVHTVNSKGETTDSYFDAEELAMRMEASRNDASMFTDSEGFQYAYNDREERWEKTGLMRSEAMSFMLPAMSMGILKLPEGPMMEATQRFHEQGVNMNTFLLVEWAFIYSPEDFGGSDFTRTLVPCPDGGGDCPKFSYEDPEYQGSYVVFDSEGRLSEIHARVDNQMAQDEGTYSFSYDRDVQVQIPNAVEVKQPFDNLFSRGLNVDDN